MALDPYVERNIVLPTETVLKGKDMVEWGDGNAYPDYLLDLYNNVTTLRTIVNGTVDFITGDDISIVSWNPALKAGTVNLRGDSIRSQVRNVAKDYELYGGFALQVIRDFFGRVAEIYYLDMRFLRMNKECDVFYYCEDWKKYGRKDVVRYPAFRDELDWASLDEDARNRNASSVLFVKTVDTQVYPAPVYAAAVKACEIERGIDDYHLNALDNSFVSSLIVNFNNGIPTDNDKEEIERDFNEKFSGKENAGRIMFSWNKNKESATDIVEPKVEDFGERYKALAEHSRQQIFTSFAATPNLFGLAISTGFNSEEYAESFKLYNRTHVVPVQDIICEAYNRILGVEEAVTITPFSLGADDTTQTLASMLGVGGTQAMMTVIESQALTIDQKKGTLAVLFGLTDEQIAAILGIPYVEPVADSQ